MPGDSKEMDPAIRTLILAERIEERVMAQGEGLDRMSGEVEANTRRVQELESTRSAYLDNGEAGLRRIIREEFLRLSEEDSSKAFNKWVTIIGLLLSLAAVAISLLL